MSLELLENYFPDISPKQRKQFGLLEKLYSDWNEKINVISRKDIQSLYEKHVLHSLGIAKIMKFADNTKVLDVGTGGGFPGIPLAVLFPSTHFTLVDSIGKKITVVKAIGEALGLQNIKTIQGRAEQLEIKTHFVVSRAVTKMPVFLSWMKEKFEKESFNQKKNGILYLKGGDLSEELKGLHYELFCLNDFFQEDFFRTKKVVYIEMV